MALIQKTIKVPAIPASEKKVNIRICDDCGREVSGVYICQECYAELCHKCAKTHPEDIGGDSEDSICESCKEVLKSYETEIDILEEKIDVLKEIRRASCQEKRKIKNETNKT